MRKTLGIASMLLLLGLVARAGILEWLRYRHMERIVGGDGVTSAATIAEEVIAYGWEDAVQVVSPFRVAADPQTASGQALELPQGAGDTGTVHFCVSPPIAATYSCWARVKWDDACGNSFLLKAGDARGFTVGQDAVYNRWHWVPAGRHVLSTGATDLVIVGREDGIAIDRLLLSADPEFSPGPDAAGPGLDVEPMRFGDAFDRSPGHGLGDWVKLSGDWSIRFTLDPNRIPNQYALHIESPGKPAGLLIDRPPWNGCRVACSFRALGEGAYGVMLDRDRDGAGSSMSVTCKIDSDGAVLRVGEIGAVESVPLGEAVRQGQWHRLAVERWGWVVRVWIDGRLVFSRHDLSPRTGQAGLSAEGHAVFDDVSCEQLIWMAEDAHGYDARWSVRKSDRWYRVLRGDDDVALLGRRGTITAATGGLPVQEALIEELGTPVVVEAPGMREVRDGVLRLFRADKVCPRVSIAPGDGTAQIRRAAFLLNTQHDDLFREGPYQFSSPRIEDPSDYLDFTKEEYEMILHSKDRGKLERRERMRAVLGKTRYGSLWNMEGGRWRVYNGVLTGYGPGARLRFYQDINVCADMSMRVRLLSAESQTGITLYEHLGTGTTVRASALSLQGQDPALQLGVGVWHTVTIGVSPDTVTLRLDDGEPATVPSRRGIGGGIVLSVPKGTVEFDDIEWLIRRRRADERYYAFDRRETDWWREGEGWLDHGGISCAFASQWISLVSPKGEGMLRHRHTFGEDLLVAFNIEENSEWYGWDRKPSHVHYSTDNVCVLLVTPDGEKGYRLEVNSRNHSSTVLYRNGKEVGVVRQDESFPIQYYGAHAPYVPRRNRILLAKQGAELVAVVNGKEVLRYTDPQPLSVSGVAIGGYDTHINFSRVEIRELKR